MRSQRRVFRWLAPLFLALPLVLPSVPAAAADTVWRPVDVHGGGIWSLGAGRLGASSAVWATTQAAGVHRSLDEGRTWVRLPKTPGALSQIAGVDPNNGDRAFLQFRPGEYAFQRLFFTTDGGATWTPSREGMENTAFVYQVVFHPTDDDVLWAATSIGLYRSEDGGLSWSLLGPFNANVFTLAVAPDDPRLLLASTLDRTYRSTDGGATFTQVFGSGFHAGLVFDPTDPDRVYATFGTIFRSTDRGQTWERIGRPFGSNSYTLAVDRDGTLHAGSDVGVIHSTDAGATFLPRATATRRFPDDNIRTVLSLPSGDVLAAGLRGIWRQPDGEQGWRASSQGIRALDIAGLAVTGEGRVLASSPWSGMFRSDDGESFRVSTKGLQDPFGLPGLELVPSPSDPKVVYGSTNEEFYRSDDGGITWRALNTPFVGQLVRIVAVDPTDPDTIYAGGPEYHPRDDYYKCHSARSRDGGATWTCLEGSDIYSLDAVVFDPERPRRLLAIDGRRFMISDDQGDTWRASGRGLPTDEGLNPVLVRDAQGRLFTLSSTGRAYRSVDGGASFAPLGRLPTAAYVSELILDPRHPDTLYAAAYQQGVFRSQDGGRRWQRLGTGLPATAFTGVIALDAEHGVLYAGTRGRGFYRLDVR